MKEKIEESCKKKACRKRKDRPATVKKKKRSCKKVKKRWLVEEKSEHWIEKASFILFVSRRTGQHRKTDRDDTRGLKRLSKTVRAQRSQYNRKPNLTSIFFTDLSLFWKERELRVAIARAALTLNVIEVDLTCQKILHLNPSHQIYIRALLLRSIVNHDA